MLRLIFKNESISEGEGSDFLTATEYIVSSPRRSPLYMMQQSDVREKSGLAKQDHGITWGRGVETLVSISP